MSPRGNRQTSRLAPFAAALVAVLAGAFAAPGPAAAAPTPGPSGGTTAASPKPKPPPRPPAATCQNPSDPGNTVRQTPWAQQLLSPQLAWVFGTGRGITVAVIDSGVDANHPQLAGHVMTGFDFLRNASGGNFDCASHGTAVASLIAAQHADGIGFEGLAPDARILPIRVTEREDNNNGPAASPAVFAKAIRYAADHGAQIINISLTLDQDFPVVGQAIVYAQQKGCLVVASAGNHHTDANAPASPSLGGRSARHTDPPSYPAAYPDVLGVGAIDQDGNRLDESQVGSYVDLVAPGGAVLAATRVRGHAYWNGTSMAAPLVSAAAALVWSINPHMSAAEVKSRLEASADPMPGPAHGPEFGYGLINPYRAVTEQLPGPTARPAPLPAVSTDPAVRLRAAQWRVDGGVAVGVGAGAVLFTVACLLLALGIRRGRARDWRPGNAPPVPAQRTVDEPEAVFFALPRRGGTE